MKHLAKLLLLAAAPLAGQELACLAIGIQGPPMRSDSVAEYIGHIVIRCKGGTPTPAGTPIPQYTLQLSLDTPITSRLTADPFSEALLLIDEPDPAIQTQRYCTHAAGCPATAGAANAPNVFQARQLSPNTLTFSGVPIDPPGPNATRTLRLVNVRANAAAFAGPPDSSIRALVSLSGPASIPIASDLLAVGYPRPGVIPSVRQTVAGYPNCASVDTTSAPTTFLQFIEPFPGAFRRRNAAPESGYDSSPTPIAQDVPDRNYGTASGFYNPTPNIVSGPDTNVAAAGLAEHGTRLFARFTNVPPGVTLTTNLYSISPDGRNVARLVTANPDGSGAFSPAASANIPIVAGAGQAVWEILAADPARATTFEFPIGISYPAGLPTGTISVAAGLAPFTTAPARPLLPIRACTVSALSPVSDAAPAAGIAGKTIAVTAPGPWTATTDVDWITITGGASGSGNGTVTYHVAANATTSDRTGSIYVSGWPVTITQPAETEGQFTLDRTSASVGPDAGSGTFTLSGPGGVSWSASANPFLTLSPRNGTGPAVITYHYTANPSALPRFGMVYLPGNTFLVNQAGIPAVPVTFDPPSVSVPMAGAVARTINVTANPLAHWTAVGTPSQVTILSGASGTGNGTVTYSVTPNPTINARQATLVISDQTYRIEQSGPTTINTSAISGSGEAKTFTFRITHPTAAANLDVVNALINTTLDGNRACYVAYSRPHRLLYLVNDDGPGSGLSAGLPLGATGSVSNSQCTVFSEGSSATELVRHLTLTLNIRFQPAFAGPKVVYVAARDTAGANSGWFTHGVWTVPGAPAGAYPRLVSLSTFGFNYHTFAFEDETDANNLKTVWMLMNTAIDGRSACYVAYHVPSDRLYLVPDNGDPAQAAGRPWTYRDAPYLQNSQCLVGEGASSVIKSGKRLYLTLNLASRLPGPRVIWTAVQNLAGQVSPWTPTGTYFAPF